MPEVDDAIGWDFLTLVDWWNLYGLPILLGLVTIVVLVRARSARAGGVWRRGSRTVLLIGLIHCVLGLQALVFLAQELLTLRVMGIPQSFVSPVTAIFGSIVNPILAAGLLRHRGWARRVAIAWYAFLSSVAMLVVAWLFYYHVSVEAATWPDQLNSKILPLFLFVIMFLPGIKRVFETRNREERPTSVPADFDLVNKSASWPILSVLTLLFLIIACSNLIVNAADWGYRLAFDSESNS
jgi:hypothetical protein